MTDPFSIVASSFAVVGAADVVLRASVECCRFLSGIKDAPAEIAQLRVSIQENKKLIESLRKHLDELRDPASSISMSANDPISALDGFDSSFRALHRELNSLQKLAKRYSGVDRTWARVKWLLDERKIGRSLEKLERSKSMLGIALSLIEGRRTASSQKRVEIMTQQGFQQITTKMDGQLRELSIARQTQEEILSKQHAGVVQLTQQLEITRLVREDQVKATRTSQTEHAMTRQEVANGNRTVITNIHTMSSKLDDVRNAMSKSPTKARISNRETFFFGQHRDAIIAPLLFMEHQVRQAVLHALSHETEDVSTRHLYWLKSEFDTLVRSAKQEDAASCEGSTATPFDRWNYSPKADALSDLAGAIEASNSKNDCGSSDTPNQAVRPHRKVYRGRKRFGSALTVLSSSSGIGQLHLMVPRASEATKDAPSINEARIMFIPNKGICFNSISARFVKFIDSNLEPRLYTQLNCFRPVESNRPHLDLYYDGTIEEIDSAFRSGVISPYDQYDGHVLCVRYAVLLARTDILRYLDSQGVGPSNLNAQSDALGALWGSLFGNDATEAISEVLAYIGEKQLLATSVPDSLWDDTPLGPFVLSTRREIAKERVQTIKKWIEFLTDSGYSLETQNVRGRTPLLDQLGRCGGQSLAIVRLLLDFGADAHAITLKGSNALHSALASNTSFGSEYPDILEEKLSLMIERGVDIHHRESWGYTPSHYARARCHCWDVWCRALKRNGLKIDEVLREDGELWLLEESEWTEEEGSDEERMTLEELSTEEDGSDD